ncbi:MAG: 2-hydroxyacid dehydrogenase [Desulfurococcales archaeon]|nr:2-hydroxyacid dehydrogenase [Desulfurococcales archaeon]
MPRFLIASMGPLPGEVVRSFFLPFLPEGVEVEVVSLHGRPRDEVVEVLRRADVVIGDHTFQMKIDRELCNAMERVRLIQQPSTGFDHIDVDACRERGIPIANAGGANSASVAEYTIMAALTILKRIPYAHERTRAGEWPQWELMDMGTYDLQGKTWGILGLGRIGREVAKRLQGWDVEVLYHDKVRNREYEERYGLKYRSLPRLLRDSDVVSLHLPLTSETRGIIGEAELRMMKPTAVLVNPSRGELVDEEALARALREGWIAGAAIDVYSREPPGPDHPLVRLAREEPTVNLLLTPHIAGANTDARQRIIRFSIENIIRVLTGGKPLAVVNM